MSAILEKYLLKRASVINEALPCKICMQAFVSWDDSSLTKLFFLEDPEFVLQEALIDGLSQEVSDFGRSCKEVSRGRKPMSITVSTEAIMALSMLVHDGTREIKGFPALLVATRKANDRDTEFKVKLLATDQMGHHCLLPGCQPPEAAVAIREAARKAKDFLAPFFDGFRNGGTTEHKFSMI